VGRTRASQPPFWDFLFSFFSGNILDARLDLALTTSHPRFHKRVFERGGTKLGWEGKKKGFTTNWRKLSKNYRSE